MSHTRLIPLFLATFCLTPITALGFDWPEEVQWMPAYVGVDRAGVTLTKPRPLQLYAIRVDLTADGIELCTNDSNGDRPLETDGCYTTTFLVQKGCQIAINGAPFGPGRAIEGETQNVSGLVISNGELVSPLSVEGEPERSAVVLRKGRLSIEQPPIDLQGVHLAIGGFGVVRIEGEPYRDLTTPAGVLNDAHPRTAIGVSSNGTLLYLVVIDGRQPGYSEGVTLDELGEIFGLLGVDNAVNLDGGGTTSMAVASQESGAELVNQPINGKVVGLQRVSANHLGVYAKPLGSLAETR